jgi:phosphate transport system protein
MRQQFHGELEGLSELMVEMTRLVGSAVGRATTALLDGDLELAESVIAADEQVDALQVELEGRAMQLLARQQPVATDLRVIVTALRMSADLERMGDLARHIAKLARMRYPNSAIPAELRATILQMGQAAERIVAKTGSVIASRDLQVAGQLETDDDVMDGLHRELFAVLLDEDWAHGVETAVDVTLCGRFYERFADHAVSVARRVTFLVTGERHSTGREHGLTANGRDGRDIRADARL